MKKMILAHKIQLDPNNSQKHYFAKAAGTARFAYNWALEEWGRQYSVGFKVTESSLRRQLNAIKHEKYPWMLEVTKCAAQLAIMNLGRAFANYFNKLSDYPQYHKKWRHDSFGISNDQFKIDGRKICIPKLGWVRMTEELRFAGKIMGAVVSRTAGKWFVSVQVVLPEAEPIHQHHNIDSAVGIDLGVQNLAVLSNGAKVAGAKAYKALRPRIRRLSKSLSRKTGGRKGECKSKNYIRAQIKLAGLHARIANIRKDETHKLTSMITKNYSIIGIEKLNIAGMLKNHRLARSISDMSFFEFRRQIEYKSKMTGSKLNIADWHYPSSKLCSTCGYKMEGDLPLSIREWECPICKSHHDRDINAAINLKNNAVSYTVSACGELVSVTTSTKQELSNQSG
ncbi:MAG: transposase [Prevotellaceae bacterium]|jgi:putative transposase|nr:transposase [Prevotellaceae bacterium]